MEIFQSIEVVVPARPVFLESGDQLFLIIVVVGKRVAYGSDFHETIDLSMRIP